MTYKKGKLHTLSESYILLQLSLPFSPDYKDTRLTDYETGGISMLSFEINQLLTVL